MAGTAELARKAKDEDPGKAGTHQYREGDDVHVGVRLRRPGRAVAAPLILLQGCATLVTGRGETELLAGMCAGFKAGSGDAHQLINRSTDDVVYLEVGDRTAGDSVVYPDDDIQAGTDAAGKRRFVHKDGTPY